MFLIFHNVSVCYDAMDSVTKYKYLPDRVFLSQTGICYIHERKKERNTMVKKMINYNLCVACGACTRVCGKQALQIIEE